MREQWKQGLQWGAVAAVAWWIAPYLTDPLYELTGAEEAHVFYQAIHVVVALSAFVLIVLTWSRFSRAALLALVAIVLWRGDNSALREPMGATFAIVRFVFWQHADAVPLLPLLLFTPERPRLTVALALMGRWRDAARTLAGWRWLPVAVGIFFLDQLAHDLGQSFGGTSNDHLPAVVVWKTGELLAAVAPFAALFGVAAIPRWGWRSRATA